jgi:class 3 adenylate cyclase/TolB-like protein
MAVLDQPISSRKLAAILSADVAGYSALMSADEEATVRKLREVRDAVLPIVGRFGGRIIDLAGDGILAEFPSAVRAVESAAAVQACVETLNAASEPRMVFRIGVNVGDVIQEGDRLYGDGINIAARLQAIAEPGGICISNKVHEEVRDRVKLAFRDMGDQELKNIARPVRAFSADLTDAGLRSGLRDQTDNAPRGKRGLARRYWKQRTSHRVKMIGGVVASVASVGAVLGGLAGYWGSWKAIRAELSPQRLTPAVPQSGTASSALATSQGPRVAVFPIENMTSDPATDAAASNLTQDFTAGLSRFGSLRVFGRNMTAPFKGRIADAPELGQSIGADYIITGNIRRAYKGLRVDVQLSNTRSRAQVWSHTFEVNPDIPSSLDEIAGVASAMIGSFPGAITAAEYQSIQSKPVNQLSSYECIVQGVTAGTLQTPASVARGRECFDLVVQREPGNPYAWVGLSTILANQRNFGFGLPPEEARDLQKRLYLDQQVLETALKAVDLAPGDPYIRSRLAVAYWATCQREPFRIEAMRAVEMNPNDANILAIIGNDMAYLGDWDRGTQLVERAIFLMGPNAPRWWWYAPAKRHWVRGEYQEALNDFQKSYVEQIWLSHLNLAYTLPFLERIDEAKAHVAALLKMKPGFTITEADAYYRMWCFEASFRDKMRDALRIAGLPE